MKKIVFAIMMMVLGMTANAETTDVSGMDNVLYINNVAAEAGTQVTLPVLMKNTAKVQTIGVYIALPEGMTVATNSRGMYQITLSDVRTDSECHTLSKSFVDGIYRVGILGTAGFPFDGNDGEVFTMKVSIPSDMLPGDYTIEMTEMELTDTDNKSYTTPSVKATLTVTTTSGINTVSANDDNGSVYNLNGQELSSVKKGVNIVGNRKFVKK